MSDLYTAGVYIKGMEMPKKPGSYSMKIRLFVRKDGTASIWGLEEYIPHEPLDVIPVPPHGRLIDANALMKILSKVIDINASIEQRNEATDQERRCLWWFEQQIGIAPTIIPAEEGE